MLRRSLKKKGRSTTKKKRRAKKNLSKPKKGAKKYPYVVHDKAIWLPNQVWAADITYVRLEHGYVYLIQISMDARNRALGNISIERFWRTLKYEDIYLKDYKDLRELREGISRYVHFYNSERFHQSLGYATPDRHLCKQVLRWGTENSCMKGHRIHFKKLSTWSRQMGPLYTARAIIFIY